MPEQDLSAEVTHPGDEEAHGEPIEDAGDPESLRQPDQPPSHGGGNSVGDDGQRGRDVGPGSQSGDQHTGDQHCGTGRTVDHGQPDQEQHEIHREDAGPAQAVTQPSTGDGPESHTDRESTAEQPDLPVGQAEMTTPDSERHRDRDDRRRIQERRQS